MKCPKVCRSWQTARPTRSRDSSGERPRLWLPPGTRGGSPGGCAWVALLLRISELAALVEAPRLCADAVLQAGSGVSARTP